MSKSICGSRYTLNIDKVNLTDFSLSTVDVKSEIKADYLTADRLLTTDTNKKIISSSTTTSEINSLSGVSSNIQTQLNAKQATITAGTNLSFDGTTLNATGGGSSTITANRVAVSDGTGALTASSITTTELDFLDGVSSAIQTQLNTKQATIGDGDLSIARTSGLQTALDTKQNILRIYNTQSLSSPNDNMYKIKNMLVLPLHTELTITSNQSVVSPSTIVAYFPNLFASANKSTTYDSAVVGRAIIDNDVFSVVEPTYNTETTSSSDKITGTNARFGVKILATGLYKITYNYNVENETHPNRIAIQIVPAILNTLTNGTEQHTLPLHLTSREYLRDDNFGQWANVGGSGLIEVSSDMLSSSNGVFVKIDIRMIRSGGEVFNENCNGVKVNYGGLEIQKIAELAT